MCSISKEVKFCTCTKLNKEELDHYWELCRPLRHKPTFLVGEMASTESWDLFNRDGIESILLKQLNNPLAFDKHYQFQEGDLFTIYINYLSSSPERMVFYFVFEEGAWVIESHHFFPQYKSKQVAEGKVEGV
jgi:hypothetical protein